MEICCYCTSTFPSTKANLDRSFQCMEANYPLRHKEPAGSTNQSSVSGLIWTNESGPVCPGPLRRRRRILSASSHYSPASCPGYYRLHCSTDTTQSFRWCKLSTKDGMSWVVQPHHDLGYKRGLENFARIKYIIIVIIVIIMFEVR